MFYQENFLKNLQWEQMIQMIQNFETPLFNFPLSSVTRTASRLITEMVQPHRMFQSGLDHKPKFIFGFL